MARTLEEIQTEARRRGGECLTEASSSGSIRTIRLRCGAGHVWQTTSSVFMRGNWCAQCERDAKGEAIFKEIQRIAKEQGGRCISDRFIRCDVKLAFECKAGHRWEASPSNIKKGTWCRECFIIGQRNTLKEMHALAKSRGWKCLSTSYHDAHSPLIWECRFGHRWEARPANVMLHGTGCPHCAGQVLTIEDMRELAKQRKGACLSKEYVNSKDRLLWRCEFGHEFLMKPNQVQQGQWCNVCAHKIPLTIDDMQAWARRQGGACLSPKYLGTGEKLRWRCRQGHEFWMTPSDVRRSHWCRFCFYERTKARWARLRKSRKGRKG